MLSLIVLLTLLVLLMPTLYAAVIGAPLAITSKSRLKEIIRAAKIEPDGKFYELGAGTGRVMVLAAKMTGAKVIGFELSPIFYLIALFNLKINGVRNYKLYLKNFFRADLYEADVVFCFLMPRSLTKLKKKLGKELRPGTKVISFAFEIPDWQPYAVIKGNKKLPVYFYKIQ